MLFTRFFTQLQMDCTMNIGIGYGQIAFNQVAIINHI